MHAITLGKTKNRPAKIGKKSFWYAYAHLLKNGNPEIRTKGIIPAKKFAALLDQVMRNKTSNSQHPAATNRQNTSQSDIS